MSDVLFGRHPVLEALRAGIKVGSVMLASGIEKSPIVDEIVSLAEQRRIPIKRVDRRELKRLTGGESHQGVAARVADYTYARFEDLLAPGTVRLVLLDGVTDPVNLGSVLRSAEAFGWTGVLVQRHRAVGVTPTVRKVAAGAAERVPVAQAGSAAETVVRLQREGVWVAGLDPGGTTDYREAGMEGARVCLVVGAEGKGLSSLVKKRCDVLARIPMRGELASLNVGVAAAVVMALALDGP